MKIFQKTVILIISLQSIGYCADLTLQDALDRSRAYWSSRIGEGQVEAEASKKLAQGTLLPNVEGTLAVQKNYLVDPSQSALTTASVGVTQNLINVSDWVSIAARKADLSAQVCQTEANQIDIAKNVIVLYFSALTNVDEDKLQAKRASKIQRAVSLLQETTKLRLSAQSDLYLAQSQAYQVEIERTQISSTKISFLNQLRSQLGISPKESLALDSNFIQQDVDIADWQKWAENQPIVLVSKYQIQAAENDISSARWELFPAIGVSATYNDPISAPAGLQGSSLSVLGIATIPIFDQMSRKIRVSRSKKLLSIFKNLYETQKNQSANEIAALIIQRQADRMALEKATNQMEISEKAYKGAWTLLTLGKNTFFDIQNAQDVSINAERQWLLIRRRLDATNANLELLFEAVKNVKDRKYSCASF